MTADADPQLQLVEEPAIGCFELAQLRSAVDSAIADVDAALGAERSRFRSVQLVRARLTLDELRSSISHLSH